jgi:hypothetical protein
MYDVSPSLWGVLTLDFLKIQLFVLQNTDTVSFPLSLSRFLRYNKQTNRFPQNISTVDYLCFLYVSSSCVRLTFFTLVFPVPWICPLFHSFLFPPLPDVYSYRSKEYCLPGYECRCNYESRMRYRISSSEVRKVLMYKIYLNKKPVFLWSKFGTSTFRTSEPEMPFILESDSTIYREQEAETWNGSWVQVAAMGWFGSKKKEKDNFKTEQDEASGCLSCFSGFRNNGRVSCPPLY